MSPHKIALAENPTADDRFKRRIVRNYFVRFHMSLMITATVVSGLISSKLLLEAGVTSVLLRYPLSVVAAYVVFLGLVKGWAGYVLIRRRRGLFTGVSGNSGTLDVSGPGYSGSGSSGQGFGGFGGGDSGGGGASDSWGDAKVDSGGSGFSLPLPSLDGDLDDGIWIVIALAAVVLAIFGAGAYMIWAAPQILPEVALNVLVAPALARATKKARERGWLGSLFLSTCIPILVVLLMTLGLAFAIHHHCPSATKLTEAFACPAKM